MQKQIKELEGPLLEVKKASRKTQRLVKLLEAIWSMFFSTKFRDSKIQQRI